MVALFGEAMNEKTIRGVGSMVGVAPPEEDEAPLAGTLGREKP